MQIVKKLALPFAVSSLTLASCINNQNKNINEVENLTVNPTTEETATVKNIDYIQYTNLNGNIVKVGVLDEATASLYSAVKKYTENGTKDITDIAGFYAEVESNIPKNEDFLSIKKTVVYNVACEILNLTQIAQRHERCSQLFNKLFDLFTSEKSEKGDTITVKESIQMMDAWTSTGK